MEEPTGGAGGREPAGTVPNLEMAAAQQQAAGSACLLQPPAVQPYCSDASAEGPPRLENLCFQLPYRLLKTGSFRARSEPSFVIKVVARSDVARGQPRDRNKMMGGDTKK